MFGKVRIHDMAKFCVKCGSRLDEATGLCPQCGAGQQAQQPVGSRQTAYPAPQPPYGNAGAQQPAAVKTAKTKGKGKAKRSPLVPILIAVLILLLLTAVTLGLLAYFHVVEVPFLSGVFGQAAVSSKEIPEQSYTPSQRSIEYDKKQNVYFANDELLVVLQADAAEEDARQVMQYVEGEPVGSVPAIGLLQIKLPEKHSLQQIDKLSQKVMEEFDCVRYATYDSAVPEAENAAGAPDDPWDGDVDQSDWQDPWADGSNWWVKAIEAQQAWAYSNQLSSIKIGVCDASFDVDHAELKGKCSFPNEALEGNNREDAALHGTHVAGILAAEGSNQEGLTGLVQKSELLLAPMGPGDSDEGALWWDSSLYAGLAYLVEGGAKVVNFSQGKSHFLKSDQPSFRDAYLQREGDLAAAVTASLLEQGYDFLIVQSAGNGAEDAAIAVDALQNGWFAGVTDGSRTASDSVSIRDVRSRILIVGGAEQTSEGGYQCTSLSNFGPQVELCAPGADIFSTVPNGYGYLSGTSAAAPMVTGVCALTWAADPSLTAPEVKELVCAQTSITVQPHPASPSGDSYPLVNARMAVESALGLEGQFRQTDVPQGAVAYNGHYYSLCDLSGLSSNTWENALAYCKSMNGYLATVTSQEENEFLCNYIQSQGCENAYLGLSNTTGPWAWCTGEGTAYTNWAPGEPGGDARYGMLSTQSPGGVWRSGSFTDSPPPAPVEEREVTVADAQASSIYTEPGYDHAPYTLIDGDLTTAWVEGAPGLGIGETVTLRFDSPYQLTQLDIYAGYQKDDRVYYKNARPENILITYSDGTAEQHTLADVKGRQTVELRAGAVSGSVTVTILSAYPGTVDEDNVITEVSFRGYPAAEELSQPAENIGTAFICEWGAYRAAP